MEITERSRRLSSRAIIFTYYKALELNTGARWVANVSNYFTTDQPQEEYAWLGRAPDLREWIGGRQPKGFADNGLTVKNKLFEATLELQIDDIRRDRTGQLMARVTEMAQRTNTHWAKLLSTLILNGASQTAYDGQYFFDTDHSEGDSGAVSNDIQVDISDAPVLVHGPNAANPSVEEFQWAVVQAISKFQLFKDETGEPMNEDANSFLVVVPTSYWPVASRALFSANQDTTATPNSQAGLASIRSEGMQINFAVNPRLNTWTDKFAVFRTDSAVKSLIRQEETGVQMKAIAEGSELEFTKRMHWYGVETWRNAAYGMWQHAMRVTLI